MSLSAMLLFVGLLVLAFAGTLVWLRLRGPSSSAVVKAPAHRCELAPVTRPCFTPAESRSACAGGAHEAEGFHCADWRRRVAGC